MTMTKLQPYNKLKKTEAIWLPQVPEHWELEKVRHLFKESTKYFSKKHESNFAILNAAW